MITRFKIRDLNSGNTELFTIEQVSSLTVETGQLHLTSGRTLYVGKDGVTAIWNQMAVVAAEGTGVPVPVPAPAATTN